MQVTTVLLDRAGLRVLLAQRATPATEALQATRVIPVTTARAARVAPGVMLVLRVTPAT